MSAYLIMGRERFNPITKVICINPKELKTKVMMKIIYQIVNQITLYPLWEKDRSRKTDNSLRTNKNYHLITETTKMNAYSINNWLVSLIPSVPHKTHLFTSVTSN